MSTSIVYIIVVSVVVLLALLRTVIEKKSLFRGFFRLVAILEISAITILLFGLIFFGCLQIVLRNFFHSGIIWADPLMRHIVLWLGCLGGVMATSRLRHINIDLFTRILPEKAKPVRDRIVYLATAAAASVLGIAAYKLILDERDFGETSFLGIQVWVLQLILPIAFFLIMYRSLLAMLLLPKVRPVDWEGFEQFGTGETESG